jgi:hypothetical protein
VWLSRRPELVVGVGIWLVKGNIHPVIKDMFELTSLATSCQATFDPHAGQTPRDDLPHNK